MSVRSRDSVPPTSRTSSPRRRLRSACAGTFRVFGVAAAIVISLTSCSIAGGSTMSEQQTNLANQRKAALSFLEVHRNVETIRFTDEGQPHGLGGSLWTAGAVVTVEGVKYQANIGFEL